MLWADASNDDPIKAEFYSDDKLLKSAVYKGYQVVLGKARPLHIEISDAVSKGDVTSLDQQNLRIANLPASDYEKDNLKICSLIVALGQPSGKVESLNETGGLSETFTRDIKRCSMVNRRSDNGQSRVRH